MTKVPRSARCGGEGSCEATIPFATSEFGSRRTFGSRPASRISLTASDSWIPSTSGTVTASVALSWSWMPW